MIIAGFGFRVSATADSLADALAQAAGGRRPDAFSTLVEKADGLRAFADARGVPLVTVSQTAAARQDTPTKSPASMQAKGLHSVAEACALAAAGDGAWLIAPRSTSDDGKATCAIAQGPDT